jgi:hypothetical protein
VNKVSIRSSVLGLNHPSYLFCVALGTGKSSGSESSTESFGMGKSQVGISSDRCFPTEDNGSDDSGAL